MAQHISSVFSGTDVSHVLCFSLNLRDLTRIGNYSDGKHLFPDKIHGRVIILYLTGVGLHDVISPTRSVNCARSSMRTRLQICRTLTRYCVLQKAPEDYS